MVTDILDLMLYPFQHLDNILVSFPAARMVVVFCLAVILRFLPQGRVSLWNSGS